MLAIVLFITLFPIDASFGEEPPKLTPEQRKVVEEVDGLIREVNALTKAGKWKEAIPVIEKVLKLQRSVIGELDPSTLGTLQLLGEFQEYVGEFAAAKKTFQELIDLTAKAYGPGRWETTNARLTLSNCKLMERLSPEQRTALEQTNYDTKKVLELGVRGKYDDALELVTAVAKARKEILGEDHPLYSNSLMNTAQLFKLQGKYANAEPLYGEILRVLKKSLGDNHPIYATGLNNLAGLYLDQGKYRQAEPLYVVASKIRKEAYGENHREYAESLNNLALLYRSQNQPAKAEPLYEETLRLFKISPGEKHPDYATVLINLAHLYCDQGEYAKADPLAEEAHQIQKDALGAKHPDRAGVLSLLADLRIRRSEYDNAVPLYAEALQIRKEALGERHPDYARSLNNLAYLYELQEKYAEAEPLYQRAVSIIRGNLEESAAIQSEADQIRHVAISRLFLDNYLTLPKADAAGLYEAVFRWHGAVTARQTFSRIAGRSTLEDRGSIEELRDVSRQMNQLVQNPPKAVGKDEQAKAIKELDDQREALEKKLASQSRDFAAYQSQRKLTPADLQKSLPDDTALIDFLIHGDTASAFVVTKKSITRIKLDLGQEFAEELAGFRGDLGLMRTRPVAGEDDVALKLRTRIWEPLEENLKGMKRVLICPDGPLCRLPFAALPGADPKQYLLEEISIVIVSVPQLLPALLASDAKKLTGAPSLLAVGDVDFDGDPAAGEKAKSLPVGLTRSGNGLSWKPLPNTKGEVELVGTLFGKLPQATVQKLLGGDATEAALERELPRHRFVHLATHGFFTPPKLVRQFNDDQSANGEKVLLPSIPPGLSSGIVCAGANKPTFQVSGVLTATQIAELDLRNVELAVLSACETSLGELSGGEGVLGLQRAFQMAGARSTITTMWAVFDQSTAELMKRMYSNRLEKGLAAAEALREAQIWVLNNGDKVGAFDAPPRAGKRTPPKYWAAFGFSGDWR